MIRFAVEPWDQVRSEILPAWGEHYDEVADPDDRLRYALAPDWSKYQRAAENGSLQIMIARDCGELIGYCFAFVETHLHYRDLLCGFIDLYWIRGDKRGLCGQWLGVRMLREFERAMLARGVKKIFGGTKVWLDASAMFQRCGWKETERLYTKWIGD